MEEVDCIINLCGENIHSKRWTDHEKHLIRESRVQSTELLVEKINLLKTYPPLFICASSTGYYGDRGDEVLNEDANPGNTFWAHVCRDWENAAQAATHSGARVVTLRMGTVLSGEGGILRKLIRVLRLGLGGRAGHGDQYMSFIAIEDLLSVVQHLIVTDHLSGPINAVSPTPMTNKVFSHVLGEYLGREAHLVMPDRVLEMIFGQVADETILCSCRAVPDKLLKDGFRFKFPGLEECLETLLD